MSAMKDYLCSLADDVADHAGKLLGAQIGFDLATVKRVKAAVRETVIDSIMATGPAPDDNLASHTVNW